MSLWLCWKKKTKTKWKCHREQIDEENYNFMFYTSIRNCIPTITILLNNTLKLDKDMHFLALI